MPSSSSHTNIANKRHTMTYQHRIVGRVRPDSEAALWCRPGTRSSPWLLLGCTTLTPSTAYSSKCLHEDEDSECDVIQTLQA